MEVVEKQEALFAAITDPSVRELAKEAIGATWRAGEEYGWRNAVGYLQDGQCAYVEPLLESSGARKFLLFLRAHDMARKPPEPAPAKSP